MIEIPAGSVDKWETDKNDGSLRWEVRDDKLVEVRPGTPFDAVHDLKELEQLFPGVTAILETWFSNYKVPGETETRGFGDVREACSTLEATCRWFEAKAKGS